MIHQTIDSFYEKSSARLTTYIIENSPEIDINRKRPAIIICPGGGYEFLSDREAEPIAVKMMSYGYQAFVLEYSVKPAVYPTALEELASAVRLVRQNSDDWHVDPERIIVAGFSAGGHLAASLGVLWQDDHLVQALGGKKEDWQPNGLLLAYPVLSSGEFAHEGSFKALLADNYASLKDELSLEKRVSALTPPTFLWHTLEDGLVPAENSLLFADALRKAGVPYELHIFPKGGHGLSLATHETGGRGDYERDEAVAVWPQLFATWVKHNVS